MINLKLLYFIAIFFFGVLTIGFAEETTNSSNNSNPVKSAGDVFLSISDEKSSELVKRCVELLDGKGIQFFEPGKGFKFNTDIQKSNEGKLDGKDARCCATVFAASGLLDFNVIKLVDEIKKPVKKIDEAPEAVCPVSEQQRTDTLKEIKEEIKLDLEEYRSKGKKLEKNCGDWLNLMVIAVKGNPLLKKKPGVCTQNFLDWVSSMCANVKAKLKPLEELK